MIEFILLLILLAILAPYFVRVAFFALFVFAVFGTVIIVIFMVANTVLGTVETFTF